MYYFIVDSPRNEGKDFFEISMQTGEIFTKVVFDREKQGAYALEVEARDGAPSARPNSDNQPNSGTYVHFYLSTSMSRSVTTDQLSVAPPSYLYRLLSHLGTHFNRYELPNMYEYIQERLRFLWLNLLICTYLWSTSDVEHKSRRSFAWIMSMWAMCITWSGSLPEVVKVKLR